MIPEAAVEAVARMLWENYEHAVSWEQSKEFDKGTARWLLEAAAPHMLGEAWDEAAALIRYDMEIGQRIYVANRVKQANPYRPTQ